MPVRYTPMRSMPMKYMPIRYAPVRCTPIRHMPMRCMPMRCMPMRCMPMRCMPNSTPMTYTPVRYKSPDFPHRGAVVDLSRSEFAKYEFFALVAKWSLLRSAADTLFLGLAKVKTALCRGYFLSLRFCDEGG